jgi:S-adenosylmethionine hydrolase
MRLITLITDFGQSDWFVGAMKGVILKIAPRATVVDITHAIPPGDVCAAAFALAACWRWFPPNAIHVAVVDPGVGSSRKAIAVRSGATTFLAPDNGLLSLALAGLDVSGIRSLENTRFFAGPPSHTFHGRDIFASCAAHLSRGVSLAKLGPLLRDYRRLDWPEPRQRGKGLGGVVIYIDHFGNAITNFRNELLTRLSTKAAVIVAGKASFPVREFYQSVPPSKPVAVPGSTGFLELAVNAGKASSRFKIQVGHHVTLRAD